MIALAVLVALVLAAVAVFVAAFDVHVGRGTGDRSYAVTSVQNLKDEYRLGIGSLELDVAALQLPVGETRIVASVDVGELRVIVPSDVGLRVHATAEIGEVDLPNGVGGDGRNVENDFILTGDRVLVVDAHVGLGSVKVERAIP